MNEEYICLDCHACQDLDMHGRCARCGSQAVMSAAKVPESAFCTLPAQSFPILLLTMTCHSA